MRKVCAIIRKWLDLDHHTPWEKNNERDKS